MSSGGWHPIDPTEGRVSIEVKPPSIRSEPGPRNSEIAKRWKEIVGEIPEDKLAWRANPEAPSLGELTARIPAVGYRTLQSLDLDAEEKALVVDELLHPCGQDQVVAEVHDQATAIEVYAVSALAVDEREPAGRDYLDRLAAHLALPPVLVEAIAGRQAAGDQAA